MKNNTTNILIATGLVLMATVSRIVNTEMHLYNFAPLAALGLFSGAVIKDKRYAFLLPLLAQLLADGYFQLFTKVQGFYPGQLFTYLGLAAATLLGTTMGQPKAAKVLGYTIGGSVLFFIFSNFGTFTTGFWGTGFKGLVTTYTMGLPFFKNTLIGDLAGSTILFGAYALLQRSTENKMQKATV
ncbi:DUF6580 family putative transport protein [Chitinophagaceae bacterium MMS25-I14]